MDRRSSAWRITPAGMEKAWEDLLDANGRFIDEAEKALCDEQQRLRLLEIDMWSKEGHDSVDYRESFPLSKEVNQFNLFKYVLKKK